MPVIFVKKHSFSSLKLRKTSLYIVASVLRPATVVKKHSVGCPILQNTSLYIVASVLMPVIFKKIFTQKYEIKRQQLIQSGQCPYAFNVCKKYSVRSLKLRDTSLNILAMALMLLSFVK
jgi:hypothetical protein